MRHRTRNGIPPLLWAAGIVVLTPLILVAGVSALAATLGMAMRDAMISAPAQGTTSPRMATGPFRVAAAPGAAPDSAVILAFPSVSARLNRSPAPAPELSLTHAA